MFWKEVNFDLRLISLRVQLASFPDKNLVEKLRVEGYNMIEQFHSLSQLN